MVIEQYPRKHTQVYPEATVDRATTVKTAPTERPVRQVRPAKPGRTARTARTERTAATDRTDSRVLPDRQFLVQFFFLFKSGIDPNARLKPMK